MDGEPGIPEATSLCFHQLMDMSGGDTVDAAAQSATISKLTPKQVHDTVMSMGVSDLDAGLIADCLNVGKSTSWMNNEDVPSDINQKLSAFLKGNGYGFEITVTPARGRYIWDVKKHGNRQ